jgi:hypothetical protein
MVAQAFVDDSGGKGSTRHFVLAALVGSSEGWAEFSEEWRACLAGSPVVRPVFKMKEAAGLSGAFWGWRKEDRDEKLRRLCTIINRCRRLFAYSMIDLEAHAKTWALSPPSPGKDPYFWPYQNTIMAVCHHLWDIGWRERFEIIYDVQMISGPKARLWYPVIQRLMEMKYPDQAQILPVDPMFKTDDEFLPLQAADLFAWCSRNATDKQEEEFSWLLPKMPNVQGTDYSQYYDLKRMQSVMDESYRLARERAVPPDLVAMVAETRALMKKRR